MRVYILVAVVALVAVSPVRPDDRFPPIASEAVKKECSDCHMVYPPQMLPQQSWQTIMKRLEAHFGEDASLDEPVRQEILSYLLAHAADVDQSENARKFLRGIDMKNPPLRITETPRFIEEHRKVSAETWSHPKVKSKANCVACHLGATQGDYNDDDVRLP
jgi:hypothetical protein